MTPANTPTCIAFVSPLGGTGQTTLVANLASVWSSQGQPCLAIDLCAQNSLALHLGLAADDAPCTEPGWARCLQAGQWWGEAAQENSEGVRFVPHGAAQAAPAQHDPAWLAGALSTLDLQPAARVLLDAPHWPQPLASQALACAALVVVCVETGARAPRLQARLQALQQALPPQGRMVLVATRYNPQRASQRAALQALQAQWPEQLAPYVLHEDEHVGAALQAAHCVCHHAPHAQAAHDMQGLARWLGQSAAALQAAQDGRP